MSLDEYAAYLKKQIQSEKLYLYRLMNSELLYNEQVNLKKNRIF